MTANTTSMIMMRTAATRAATRDAVCAMSLFCPYPPITKTGFSMGKNNSENKVFF